MDLALEMAYLHDNKILHYWRLQWTPVRILLLFSETYQSSSNVMGQVLSYAPKMQTNK